MATKYQLLTLAKISELDETLEATNAVLVDVFLQDSGKLTALLKHAIPITGELNVNAAATALPNNPGLSSVTIQALSGNAGAVYIGDSTVTNAAGANTGLKLAAGDTYGPVSVGNTSKISVAADQANDDIVFFAV